MIRAIARWIKRRRAPGVPVTVVTVGRDGFVDGVDWGTEIPGTRVLTDRYTARRFALLGIRERLLQLRDSLADDGADIELCLARANCRGKTDG